MSDEVYEVHDATFVHGDTFEVLFDEQWDNEQRKIGIYVEGEWATGEVWIGDVFYAHYERNANGDTVCVKDGVVLDVIRNDEEDWYKFARSKVDWYKETFIA